MNAVSLFSGCGGLDLGLREAGFKIIVANDSNPLAVKTYQKNIRDLSEENFRTDPDSFVLGTSGFDQENYLKLIEDKFANDLHIINKVSARGGVARKPFQAELTILRKFGLINDFRRSVGLEIEWPLVFDIMNLNFSRDPEQSFVR